MIARVPSVLMVVTIVLKLGCSCFFNEQRYSVVASAVVSMNVYDNISMSVYDNTKRVNHSIEIVNVLFLIERIEGLRKVQLCKIQRKALKVTLGAFVTISCERVDLITNIIKLRVFKLFLGSY